jgi:acetate kinase
VDNFLILNVGSSSLKFAGFSAVDLRPIKKGSIDGIKGLDPARALAACARQLGDRPTAIAHRIVHGGPAFDRHQRITPELIAGLKAITDFAPNHLPLEISFIEAAARLYPHAPQIACFDTVFYNDMPEVAKRLPLPARFAAQGLRRYGFHGLSYTYLIQKLREIAGDKAEGKVILAHLGSGASMTALDRGKPIDTTMGFTPLGGLVMATRSGDLDPGAVSFLQKTERLSAEDFETMVSKESGMKGISETSGDVRILLEQETSDPRAAAALQSFCYHARKWIGALAATLGGLDVLVFSGGIGEHAAPLRERICLGLGHLGIAIDRAANARSELCISKEKPVSVMIVPTDEEQAMAAITREILA